MIKILIVDDQKTVRESLKVVLGLIPDLKVVGTADNGQFAIAQVEKLHPDVVLVDMEMPGIDGIATTKIICQQFTGVRVIVLSMHDDDRYVAQAVRAGAMGYLLKSTPTDELQEAIRNVYRGYAQIGPGLLSKIVTVSAQPIGLDSDSDSNPVERNSLSPLAPVRLDSTNSLRQKKRRYWLIWLMGNGALWTISILYIIFKPPTYSSSWTLTLPGTASSTSINLPEIGQASSQNQSPFSNLASDPRENYKLLAISDEVVEKAAASVEMTPLEFGEPVVKILDNTTLMELKVEGRSPEESKTKAIAVHQAFQSSLEQLKARESTEPDKNALQTIENAQSRLEKARQELANYQRSSGLSSSQQLENLAGNIEQMRLEKSQLIGQARRAGGKAQELTQEIGLSSEQVQAALKLHSDRLFGQYLDNYNQIQTELVNLTAKFLPSHPTVVAKEEDSKSAAAALLGRASSLLGRAVDLDTIGGLGLKSHSNQDNSQKENLLKDLIELQGEQRGLQDQAQELEQQIAQLEILQQQRSSLGSELDRLKKNVQIAEVVYSSALTELEINQANTANIYPPVSLMTQPSLPKKPSSPKTGLVVLGSLVASGLLTTTLLSLWGRDRRNHELLFLNNGRGNHQVRANASDSLDIILKS